MCTAERFAGLRQHGVRESHRAAGPPRGTARCRSSSSSSSSSRTAAAQLADRPRSPPAASSRRGDRPHRAARQCAHVLDRQPRSRPRRPRSARGRLSVPRRLQRDARGVAGRRERRGRGGRRAASSPARPPSARSASRSSRVLERVGDRAPAPPPRRSSTGPSPSRTSRTGSTGRSSALTASAVPLPTSASRARLEVEALGRLERGHQHGRGAGLRGEQRPAAHQRGGEHRQAAGHADLPGAGADRRHEQVRDRDPHRHADRRAPRRGGGARPRSGRASRRPRSARRRAARDPPARSAISHASDGRHGASAGSAEPSR